LLVVVLKYCRSMTQLQTIRNNTDIIMCDTDE